MKTSEILRKLADELDQEQTTTSHLEPVEVDNTDKSETSAPIPPLQAKLELLKKSLGMENAYDKEPCDADEQPDEDELDQIKKMAGIPIAITHEMADDDGPFEG